MPNRNLQAKHIKGQRQRQAAAAIEYGKMGYQTARPFEADKPRREKLSEPRKVEWFDRESKRSTYVPTPAKRRQQTHAPAVLNSWTMDNSEWRPLSHRGRRVLRAAE